MNTKTKFLLVLAGLCAFLTGGFLLIVGAVWADFQPHEQQLLADSLTQRIGLVSFMLAAGFVGIGALLHLAFRKYVFEPLRIAEEVRTLLTANRAARATHSGGDEFVQLVQSINELAEQRDALQLDVEEKIREARMSIEAERNRLAALMSELTQSVVVCNLDGRIILYNNRARLQFKALAEGGAPIGLGRSIFAIFERNLIGHALESIQHRLRRAGSQPVANFVTTTRAGQLLRVQMAPVLTGNEGEEDVERQVTGYVLMLDNITRNFETESRRDAMLQALTEGSRASLANIRAAVETLVEYGDMETEQRDRFLGVIGEEVRGLSQRLDATVTEYADSLKARWPLEEMLGADLVAAAQRRIESRLGMKTRAEDIDGEVWLKVDSFSLLQGLTYLAARLKEEFDIHEVRFRLSRSGRLGHIDMMWAGTTMAMETVHTWELDPMNAAGESTPLTLHDVTERHGGELWFQRDTASQRAYVRLLIPAALPQQELETQTLLRGESRPEYYDFDLFGRSEDYGELDDRPLTEIAYTVFDTETTGLDPAQGDEIIQIGATRIVNGRLLRQESYEQLVDPQRPLNPESAHIHGITEKMLVGQPTIAAVLPVFHAFCEDTVLVAHNAAFDLRFLQMKEASTGVRFTHPVLDTLLLSAVIHPNQDSHRLEAIAERLGIAIIGRHTALGDAIVTGEVFLRMIPLLADKGIKTLRQAREAAQQTYYARVKY